MAEDVHERVAPERERFARRQALLRERGQYEEQGLTERVALVNAELARVGAADEASIQSLSELAARHREGRAETEEDRKNLIEALLRERRGYERVGRNDRAELVNAELRRPSAEGVPPAKRPRRR